MPPHNMSLFDLERLLDRLDKYLEGEVNSITAERDAKEYNAFAESANNRLEQVVAMLGREDLHQARQLEGRDPCLSDLIQQLSWYQLPDWKEFCKKNKHPLPTELNQNLVVRLDELFSADLKIQDELWKDFSGANLEKDYETARLILQRIIRADPHNKDAREEMDQLDRLDYSSSFDRLEYAVKANDSALVLKELDNIDSQKDRFPPDAAQHRIWHEAKQVQVATWLDWLREYKGKEDWGNALHYYREINHTKEAAKVDLSSEDAAEMQKIEEWASRIKQQTKAVEQFRTVYYQVEDALGQAKLPNREATLLSKKQGQDELQRLGALWIQLDQFEPWIKKKIDPEVAEHYRRRTHELRIRLEQIIRRGRLMWAAGCAIFLLIVSVVIYFTQQGRDKRDWKTAINSAMGSKQFNNLSNLVTKAVSKYGKDIPSELSLEYSKAKRILEDQEALFKQENDKVANLEQVVRVFREDLKKTKNPEYCPVDKKFKRLQASITNLWPDPKKPVDTRLALLEKTWEMDVLEHIRTNSLAHLKIDLEEIHQVISNKFWPKHPNTDTLQALIKGTRARMDEVKYHLHTSCNAVADEPNNWIPSRDKYTQASAVITKRQREVDRYQEAYKQLANCHNESDFDRILRETLPVFIETRMIDAKTMADIGHVTNSIPRSVENREALHDKIIEDLVFSQLEPDLLNSIRNRGTELFPKTPVPENIQTRLLKIDNNIYIRDVWYFPGGGKLSPFYVSNTKKQPNPWVYFNEVLFAQQPGQIRLYPNFEKEPFFMNLRKEKFIASNEDFSKAHPIEEIYRNGNFQAAPIDYLGNLCAAIADGKLDPVIGFWKLHTFVETLFPRQKEQHKPVTGTCWDYGFPPVWVEQMAKKIKDLRTKIDPLLIITKNQFKEYSWVNFYPAFKASRAGVMKNKAFDNWKNQVVIFAEMYRDHKGVKTAQMFHAFRKGYVDVNNKGLEFAGYFRNNKKVMVKKSNAHLIGLVGGGKWGMVWDGRKLLTKPLEFSPLFALESDFCRIRALPEIDWHKFPRILQYP